MSQAPVQDSPDGAVLTVHVQPKAARTELAGIHGDAIKIRVAAPPVGGAANEELCSFLAERLNLPKSAVLVLSGPTSRRKRILLKGVPSRRLRDIFGQ